MSEWKEYKLNSLCKVGSSKRIFSSDYVISGIPFFRSKEIIEKSFGDSITEPLFISELRFKEIDEKFGSPKEGDILISSVGARSGIPYLVTKKDGRFYFKDGNLIWIKNFSENLDSLFLLYWLKSNIGQESLASIMIGSAQPALTIDGISNLFIEIPDVKIQKKIADVLSCLDAKIENLRRQNETLENIAQTLFKHWFIDFEFPNADGKPYKSSGGAMVPSELGDIPEGWRIFRLIDIVEQLKPGTNYQPKRVSQGIPFINVKNIQNGFLNLQDVKYITEEEYQRVHKSWIPKENDILISRIGTLGNVGVIRKQDLPVAVHYNNLNIKSKKISFQLLYFILKSDFFQTQYHSKKMQSVQEYITVEEAGNLKIILPELPQALGDFERIFKNNFDKIRNNENQIQTLTKIRDLLLPKLMSGQIRVEE